MSTGQPPLDDHQYTVAGLRNYEAVYGRDFVSPGGEAMTREIIDGIEWASRRRVLDIGCGLGGAAFMFAREFEAHVHGIDASQNMITEATRRSVEYGLAASVDLIHGDVVAASLPGDYDVVHSREVFLHVHAKQTLYSRIHELLAPGGLLVFTDYCRGEQRASESFNRYVAEFGYDLRTVADTAALLAEAGFTDIDATDQGDRFVAIHEAEIDSLGSSGLDAEARAEIHRGWLAKIERARAGEQRWGWFSARRPLS